MHMVLLYFLGKTYKVTWGEEVNGHPVASNVEQIPNAEIKKVNSIIQITTHFGTFTENDSGYYNYDSVDQWYQIYNEVEDLTYSYNSEGVIVGIDVGNETSSGGLS